MSDVFISWGSPDAEVVIPLSKRLKDTGYNVFEYRRDMAVGNDIQDRVKAEIKSASLAIVCLSDKTAQREWIITEVAWLDDQRKTGSLKAILPIKVGTLDEDTIPMLLRGTSILPYNPSQPEEAEATIERLLDEVARNMGFRSPIVTPAALFAMTAAQFEELAPNLAGAKALLCQHLGMQAASPELALGLKSRYGGSVEAFAPFTSDKALVETIYSAVKELNGHRLAKGEAPIHIRWVHNDFASADQGVRKNARDRWRSSSSILIIDSLSTEHDDIRRKLDDVPDLAGTSAVIWVPPYTQRTAELESKILEATQFPLRLSDFFGDWTRREHRGGVVPWRAFDIGTETGLWNWFYKMCHELAEPQPLISNIEAMTRNFKPPSFNPRDLRGR